MSSQTNQIVDQAKLRQVVESQIDLMQGEHQADLA